MIHKRHKLSIIPQEMCQIMTAFTRVDPQPGFVTHGLVSGSPFSLFIFLVLSGLLFWFPLDLAKNPN